MKLETESSMNPFLNEMTTFAPLPSQMMMKGELLGEKDLEEEGEDAEENEEEGRSQGAREEERADDGMKTEREKELLYDPEDDIEDWGRIVPSSIGFGCLSYVRIACNLHFDFIPNALTYETGKSLKVKCLNSLSGYYDLRWQERRCINANMMQMN